MYPLHGFIGGRVAQESGPPWNLVNVVTSSIQKNICFISGFPGGKLEPPDPSLSDPHHLRAVPQAASEQCVSCGNKTSDAPLI